MTNWRYLSQLFRSPFLRKVATNRYYQELAERLELAELQNLLEHNLSNIFDTIYDLLLKHYRCEYVFKNALTTRCMAEATGRMYITDEFRVGQSRVDLAVFGDTSIAYEIKTDLDSLTRLAFQTDEYAKVFDLVYVITTPTFRSRIAKSVPAGIGLMELDDSGEFHVIRQSQSHFNKIDLNVAFDCLRLREMVAISEDLSNKTVTVPRSLIYRTCKRQFRTLLPFEGHKFLLMHLRSRGYASSSESLMFDAPQSLKHAALMLRATKREVSELRYELCQTPRKPNVTIPTHEHILPTPQRKTTRTVSTSEARC
jgi:hypothetical protein